MVAAMQAGSKDFSEVAAGMRKKVSALKEEAKQAKSTDANLEKRASQEADEIMGNLETRGPPALAVYAATVESLATQEVGLVNRQALEALKEGFKDDPPDYVRICRLESCRDDEMIKIVFALDDVSTEKLIMMSFRAMGATVTQGMAPAGYLEEESSAWIDVLKG